MIYSTGIEISRRLLVLGFVGGILLTLPGCTEKVQIRSQINVQDLRYRLLPGGARIITGTVVNDGDDPVSVVQIDVSLFDEDNRRISSMFVVVQNIEARGQKNFRESVDVDLLIHGARVRSIIVP
ncbi:MAG: hypothetical protein BMS9Abin05_0585 [Rhodothermia bacterium]|nr:MAG: hypothetical protein BMS9Abin05_0585 [Rhodothermia bacterium]